MHRVLPFPQVLLKHNQKPPLPPMPADLHRHVHTPWCQGWLSSPYLPCLGAVGYLCTELAQVLAFGHLQEGESSTRQKQPCNSYTVRQDGWAAGDRVQGLCAVQGRDRAAGTIPSLSDGHRLYRRTEQGTWCSHLQHSAGPCLGLVSPE